MSNFNDEIKKDKKPSIEDLRLADYYYKSALNYYNMKNYKRANTYFLNASEHYEKYVLENPEYVSYEFAYCCQRIGRFYMDSKLLKESIKYFNRAIELYEVLLKDNPEDIAINRDLSQSYDDAAYVLRKVHDDETAKKYLIKAVKIRKWLVEERNLKEFRFALSVSYNDIALIKKSTNKKDAEKYFIASMLIRKQLAEENPDKYTLNLSYVYTNLAVFYNENESDKADKYYLSAIYLCEQLAEKDYEYYCDDLADAYYGYSIYCMESKNDYVQAEQLALYAQKIYEHLAEGKSVKRLHYLVRCLDHLGRLYNKTNQNQKSEEYLLRALDIEKKNFESNPLYCGDTLINIFAAIIEFYYKINDVEKVEEYTLLKIDCYKKLDKLNPSKYTKCIMDEYCWLHRYFNDMNNLEKAEESFLSYIDFLESVAADGNIDAKNILAKNCMSLGNFYLVNGNPDAADRYLLKSINQYEDIVKSDFRTSDIEDLAIAYSNLADKYTGTIGEVDDCIIDGKIEIAEKCLLADIELREYLLQHEERPNYRLSMGISYNRTGLYYLRFCYDEKPEEARRYFQKSVETLEKVDDKYSGNGVYFDLAVAYGNLGLTYKCGPNGDMNIAKRLYLSGIELLEKALKMGDTSHAPELAEEYRGIIEVCEDLVDYESVEKYSDLLSALNDDMED